MTSERVPSSDSMLPLPLRVIGAVSTVCGILASFMILASVLITCQMIWVRFVLGKSTIWQTEAVIYLMIAATLIGLPYVQKLRGHVSVDLLENMMPPRMRRGLAIFTLIITSLMMAVMLYYAWEMFHLAWSRGWKSETVWAVPLWIPYISVPLGLFLFLLQIVADLWATIARLDPQSLEISQDRRH